MALQFNHLNSRQRQAVLHSLGPLLILAGAGSGKTSTMAYRMAHLVTERHVPASDILGLSFTNKAAKELKQRVTQLISQTAGYRATRGLVITTFHSLCARILRVHAARLGFQTNFTILDQNDQIDVLRQVLKNIKIDERRFEPELILFEIGQAKNRFLTAEQAEAYFSESGRLSQDYALAASASFPRYQEHLRVLNAMDFDDLIFHTVALLEEHAEVRDQYGFRFRHILVDEYQDTNPAQFKILRLLTEKQQNLCVVGDDDQSIYAWRGADPTHILGFAKQFPAAKTIALDQNYRSTSRILEAANNVIAKNKNRFPKKLWSDRGEGSPLNEIIVEDDRAESEFVGEQILAQGQGPQGAQYQSPNGAQYQSPNGAQYKENSRPWKDFAILYRSNAQSRVFEEALRRRAIPYKIVGGLSFLARKEVKDVLSYWRLAVNPKDDASLRRVINWPARGIGKASIEILGGNAFTQSISFFEVLSSAPQCVPKTAAAVLGFRSLIVQLQSQLQAIVPTPEVPMSQAMVTWAQASLEKIQSKKAILEECDDPVQAARKWENVEELIHSIGQFKGETQTEVSDDGSPHSIHTGVDFLRDFLNLMTLQAQDDEKDEDKKDKDGKNQVTLLTLHGAKGLEYPVVFMVGMEEGFLPHRRTLEELTDLSEERRLCYVGITRARDHLYLVRAKNRIRYGKPVPRAPSRFLEEIPKDLLLRNDQSTTPDFTSKEAEEVHEGRVKNYLAEIRANLLKK